MKNFNTEEERKAFDAGVLYLRNYILFCIKNSAVGDDITMSNIFHFYRQLFYFLVGKTTYIPNTKNDISFKDFCEHSVDD